MFLQGLTFFFQLLRWLHVRREEEQEGGGTKLADQIFETVTAHSVDFAHKLVGWSCFNLAPA